MLLSVNPATGREFARTPLMDATEVNQALEAAAGAQRAWCRTPISSRSALLIKIAKVLRERAPSLAALITAEMGKPLAEAAAEIEKCAVCCEFYAENAAQFLAEIDTKSNATDSYVVLDPIGVVLAIMPWNYPFWQLVRFAAPALAAGNGIAIKHAGNVQQCAAAFVAILGEAGVPPGLVCNLLLESTGVAAIIDDPRIAAVTLTGSTEVGSIVAAQAGRVLKKQVLELGGSDPFIVLADADIDGAAKTAVKARFQNAGQSCISAKRFIVEDRIADAFVAGLCKGVEALVIGDPMDSATSIGPMARDSFRADLEKMIDRSVAAGAKLLLGGRRIEGPGFFFAPTVLDHVTPDMDVFQKETFGPVAAVSRVPNAEAAVQLANATEFGLGAALWTEDLERAREIAREIEAGAVFINGLVASDSRLPFGGVKRSGYGRELGLYGLREFTNVKTVWIGPVKAA